jgi:hypothetical protein
VGDTGDDCVAEAAAETDGDELTESDVVAVILSVGVTD